MDQLLQELENLQDTWELRVECPPVFLSKKDEVDYKEMAKAIAELKKLIAKYKHLNTNQS